MNINASNELFSCTKNRIFFRNTLPKLTKNLHLSCFCFLFGFVQLFPQKYITSGRKTHETGKLASFIKRNESIHIFYVEPLHTRLRKRTFPRPFCVWFKGKTGTQRSHFCGVHSDIVNWRLNGSKETKMLVYKLSIACLRPPIYFVLVLS